MKTVYISIYSILLILLNPLTLYLIFDNQMQGKIFTSALIIFDILLISLIILTHTSKKKLEQLIFFASIILFSMFNTPKLVKNLKAY